jgi:hypothetical protein
MDALPERQTCIVGQNCIVTARTSIIGCKEFVRGRKARVDASSFSVHASMPRVECIRTALLRTILMLVYWISGALCSRFSWHFSSAAMGRTSFNGRRFGYALLGRRSGLVMMARHPRRIENNAQPVGICPTAMKSVL